MLAQDKGKWIEWARGSRWTDRDISEVARLEKLADSGDSPLRFCDGCGEPIVDCAFRPLLDLAGEAFDVVRGGKHYCSYCASCLG